jgi:hypothetical protein
MSCCGGAVKNCVNTSCITIRNGNNILKGQIIGEPIEYNHKMWVQIMIKNKSNKNKNSIIVLQSKIKELIKNGVLNLNTLGENNKLNLNNSKAIRNQEEIDSILAQSARNLSAKERNNLPISLSKINIANIKANNTQVEKSQSNGGGDSTYKNKHNIKNLTKQTLSLINEKFDLVIKLLKEGMIDNNKEELVSLNEKIIKYLNLFKNKRMSLFKKNNIINYKLLKNIDNMIKMLEYINNMKNKSSPIIYSAYSETLKPFIELLIELISKKS